MGKVASSLQERKKDYKTSSQKISQQELQKIKKRNIKCPFLGSQEKPAQSSCLRD
jgi:hypothetical protein